MKLQMSDKKFWFALLFYRMLWAFNTQNIVQADQVWQSVNVAYDMVYGGVNLPWEWNPDNAIRGVIFPLMYALYFKILNMLYLDFRFFIQYGPNLINSILF